MYNTFECHFKPNKKKQRELGDPVIENELSTCNNISQIVFPD